MARRARMLDVIRQQGFVSIPELRDSLEVSESTIRRDLESLEESGEARRTHGGVFYTGSVTTVRQFQRGNPSDGAWDKKRAKELREEELANQELYQGKEQFVTEAYRKKLQEQQRWREAQERMEEQERDVTQMDKVGFSGSSAALLRNVIHGNTNPQELDASYSPPKEMNEANVVPPPSTIISQGQTNSTTFNIGKGGVSKERFPSSASKLQAEEIKANDWKAERITLLQQRESKLAAARDRYFARINLVS